MYYIHIYSPFVEPAPLFPVYGAEAAYDAWRKGADFADAVGQWCDLIDANTGEVLETTFADEFYD